MSASDRQLGNDEGNELISPGEIRDSASYIVLLCGCGSQFEIGVGNRRGRSLPQFYCIGHKWCLVQLRCGCGWAKIA